MHKPSQEVMKQAHKLRAAGRNHKEIMAETGLSHSQMEREFMRADIENSVIAGGFLKVPETLTEKAVTVARLRNEGESWGLISVRFNEPESRTRKGFAEATGMDSAGMRIGKGGRYLAGDPRFYTGSDRAKLGTELVATVPALNQIPDPEATAKRVLPKIAAAKVKGVRKARKPAAPKPKQLTAGE